MLVHPPKESQIIRLICNADILALAHTNAMFKDMSILNLSEFVKYKTANMMFNLFHGILPIQLQRRFAKYSSVRSSRQNKVICNGSSKPYALTYKRCAFPYIV